MLIAHSDLEIALPLERFGFRASSTGGHMARSMMLEEIRSLISTVPVEATREEYKRAIVADNVLGKPTFSSRGKSYRHLQELYGLERTFALFRVFRKLAAEEPASVPLLAMTCTFCRDSQLRYSFRLVEQLRVAEGLTRERMEAHFEEGFPGRFSAAMKKSLAQNVNTTWTAAGHLAGKARKRRTMPVPRIAASTYAMLAGYLLGFRGEILVRSVFGSLVGASPAVIVNHLTAASGRGWLRFRHAGAVVEIDFSPILTPEEQHLSHGAI